MTALLRSDASLGELLHARAVEAAPRRLAFDLIVGASVAAIALWLRPKGFVVVASVGLCFFLYGVWALAERRLDVAPLDPAHAMPRLVRGTRAAAATLGLLTLIILFYSLWGLTLGTWIS